MSRQTTLTVVIPTRNEATQITRTLMALLPLRHAGHEIIVIDGESSDNTAELAWSYCDQVITSSPGRARQMNAGAEKASGHLLLFLHADTRLSRQAIKHLEELIKHFEGRSFWGRFDVRLSGQSLWFRIIERCMNLRSRLTGIATGDQGLFVTTDLFQKVGGFPDIPIMEDIALSKALRKLQRPVCLKDKLVTSSRRWEQRGILRTILLMWGLRLGYFLGVSPDRLKRYYS
ncbi:MAG: glycosyltransferase [Gammaproteobacteria bacterium]|nr:MAG: glycosyltransferase [Gammaproteobacteria bacterium]